jgi:hypothetical protein
MGDSSKAISSGEIVVKASAAEVITGTDDAKFTTAKALADAGIVPGGGGGTVISTNTTITVKLSGGDFTTLQAAWDSLANTFINPGVVLTIQLDDGTWVCGAEINLYKHPQGDRINIVGTTTYTFNVTSVQSATEAAPTTIRANSTPVSLGAVVRAQQYLLPFIKCTTAGTTAAADPGSWSMTEGATKTDGTAIWTTIPPRIILILNVSSVANTAVGDYVGFKTPSGGTNPNFGVGAAKITNVDSGNTRITVEIYNVAGAPGNLTPSGAVTLAAVGFKTILDFYTAPAGIICESDLGLIDKLAIVGKYQGTSRAHGLLLGTKCVGGLSTLSLYYNPTVIVNDLLIAKFTTCLYLSRATLRQQGTAHVFLAGANQSGVVVENASFLLMGYYVVSGCDIGFQVTSGSYAMISNAVSHISGCTAYALYCYDNSFIVANSVKMYGPNNASNVYAILCFRGSYIGITSCTLQAINSACQAKQNSFINAVGWTASSATCSPGTDTVGNANSFINTTV